MAERKQESPSSELEPAQEEPTKKQVLEKWSKVLKEEKPTTFKLLMACYELLNSPHLIEGPLSLRISTSSSKSGGQKPGFRSVETAEKETADLVAYFVEGLGRSLPKHARVLPSCSAGPRQQ